MSDNSRDRYRYVLRLWILLYCLSPSPIFLFCLNTQFTWLDKSWEERWGTSFHNPIGWESQGWQIVEQEHPFQFKTKGQRNPGVTPSQIGEGWCHFFLFQFLLTFARLVFPPHCGGLISTNINHSGNTVRDAPSRTGQLIVQVPHHWVKLWLFIFTVTFMRPEIT